MTGSSRKPTKPTNRKIIARDEQTGAQVSVETDPETGVDIVRRQIDFREANSAQVSAFLRSMTPDARKKRMRDGFARHWQEWEADLSTLPANIPELPKLRALMKKWSSAHHADEDTIGILNQMVAEWNLAIVRIERRERKAGSKKGGDKAAATNRSAVAHKHMLVRAAAAKLEEKGKSVDERRQLAERFEVSTKTIDRILKKSADR